MNLKQFPVILHYVDTLQPKEIGHLLILKVAFVIECFLTPSFYKDTLKYLSFLNGYFHKLFSSGGKSFTIINELDITEWKTSVITINIMGGVR